MIYLHDFKFEDLEKARDKQEQLVDDGHHAVIKHITDDKTGITSYLVNVRFNW